MTVLDSTLSQVVPKHCSFGGISCICIICSELSINMVILLLYIVLVVKFYLQYYFVSIPKELKQEIIRTLTADNPHVPRDIIRFNFKVSVT